MYEEAVLYSLFFCDIVYFLFGNDGFQIRINFSNNKMSFSNLEMTVSKFKMTISSLEMIVS